MVRTLRLSALCGFLAFCSLFLQRANASTFTPSGTFMNDASNYEYTFNETGMTDFSAATTSYATGGFVPVLTLFNATTGAEVDNDGTGLGDVSVSDVLGAGSYDLFLTEFPNTANGDLSAGFLLDAYSDAATYTGDTCSATGQSFYNTITCTPTSNSYALSITTNAVATTPEPATWLLVLPPALLLIASRRRRDA